ATRKGRHTTSRAELLPIPGGGYAVDTPGVRAFGLWDLDRADLDTWLARVEPDDLVTASEIARRARRSRQSIQQLVEGTRGPGGFPPPVSSLTKRSPIWRWAEVAQWFRSTAPDSKKRP
ncbi:MAG: GTPase RsgA, partial [Planctomycetota bacterium]